MTCVLCGREEPHVVAEGIFQDHFRSLHAYERTAVEFREHPRPHKVHVAVHPDFSRNEPFVAYVHCYGLHPHDFRFRIIGINVQGNGLSDKRIRACFYKEVRFLFLDLDRFSHNGIEIFPDLGRDSRLPE